MATTSLFFATFAALVALGYAQDACPMVLKSNSHVLGADPNYDLTDEESCKQNCQANAECKGIDWK